MRCRGRRPSGYTRVDRAHGDSGVVGTQRPHQRMGTIGPASVVLTVQINAQHAHESLVDL